MKHDVVAIFVAFVLVVGLIAGAMYAIPKYRIWSREMRGRAALAEAEWDRQILIREAEATLEAEILNAQAEIERAKGMAAAMEIENGMLTETYIRYLWVRYMADNENVIYIPTEAAIPILEIGR
ncbi:MAG: hypothetical protein LBI27_03845 [Clostridiales bacterium]|jgi:hypothetical protein|nr:hypothetical protein [Clostridiales bacterium]